MNQGVVGVGGNGMDQGVVGVGWMIEISVGVRRNSRGVRDEGVIGG